MDELVLRPLRAIYADLERRFKVGCDIGLSFTPTNGIPKGCPLSVILINLRQAVGTRAMTVEMQADPTSYADDPTILGARPAVQAAGFLTLRFCELTGQVLNTPHRPPPTQLWATDQHGHGQVLRGGAVRSGDHRLDPTQVHPW